MATEIWSPFGNVVGYLSRKPTFYEVSGQIADGSFVYYAGPDAKTVSTMYVRATIRAWLRAKGLTWLRPPHAHVQLASPDQ